MSTSARLYVVVGLCAVGLASLGGSAGAAWTTPQELPGTAGRFPLFAAYGVGGATNVAVYGPLAIVPGSPQVPVAISSSLADGGFGSPVALPDGLGSPVALSPGGTMLAVGGPRSPLDYFQLEGHRASLRVGIGPVGGVVRRVSMPRIVATKTLASAVNDRGDAAVVFSRCVTKGCSKRSVLATFRRRGRRFTTPIVLAKRTGYPAAAVALNAHGDAIMAWIEHRHRASGNDVRVRVRRANGALTKTRVAGPTAPVPTIVVTLSPRRHGTVAWFSEPVGEGSVGGPLTVSASELDSRGTIGARNQLDSGSPSGHGESDAVQGARLRVIVGADGVPTFAWTGFADGHYVVRAQRLHRGVGTVETISPPTVDAQLMDLVADSAGDVLAVWASVPGTTTTPVIAAVIRPAGSNAFGAPQPVLFAAGTDVSETAVGAIAPGGRAIIAAGRQPFIGGPEAARVQVSRLIP